MKTLSPSSTVALGYLSESNDGEAARLQKELDAVVAQLNAMQSGRSPMQAKIDRASAALQQAARDSSHASAQSGYAVDNGYKAKEAEYNKLMAAAAKEGKSLLAQKSALIKKLAAL